MPGKREIYYQVPPIDYLAEYLRERKADLVTQRQTPISLDPGEIANVWHYAGTTVVLAGNFDHDEGYRTCTWLSVFADDDKKVEKVFSELEQIMLGRKPPRLELIESKTA